MKEEAQKGERGIQVGGVTGRKGRQETKLK